MARELRCPDGIAEPDLAEDRGFRRHASPVSVLVFGGILAAALAGLFGGGKATTVTTDAPEATLTVTTPHTMRNGVFFETRIAITAKRAIAEPTVAIPPSLWHDLTINTTVPGASEEEFKDGTFRFKYGPLKAGERLDVKIDGQVNPPLFAGTRGDIALLDGDTPLAAVPLSLKVLP